jgi:hypothetical protein
MKDPLWIQAVPPIVSVISLILTSAGLYQIWLARRSLRTNTIAELYRQQNALNMFFVENQSWRPFFYEQRSVEEADFQGKLKTLMTIAEMVTDLMEHVLVQLPNLEPDIQLGWENYIINLYEQSPAIKKHLDENGAWYSEKLVELLHRKNRPSQLTFWRRVRWFFSQFLEP